MKKLLIPAFVCMAAMFNACGDDSSSASSESVDSSSSVAAESSSSAWIHEEFGDFVCTSAKDTTFMLWYVYEGSDSAMVVTKYEYPIECEEAAKKCEELKAENGIEQEADCDSVIATINPPQNMDFDSLKTLMGKECQEGKVVNAVDLIDPEEAPENSLWKRIKKTAQGIGDCALSLWSSRHCPFSD